MNKVNDTNTKLLLDRTCSLWRDFCEVHNELYALSCQEHIHLINSELEDLDQCVTVKKSLIEIVDKLEAYRKELISEINGYFQSNAKKASEIINLFQLKTDADILEKYNLLLVDIIEKIQTQNKHNRIFLNKALYSLNQIKKDFSGENYVETYNSQGARIMGAK